MLLLTPPIALYPFDRRLRICNATPAATNLFDRRLAMYSILPWEGLASNNYELQNTDYGLLILHRPTSTYDWEFAILILTPLVRVSLQEQLLRTTDIECDPL